MSYLGASDGPIKKLANSTFRVVSVLLVYTKYITHVEISSMGSIEYIVLYNLRMTTHTLLVMEVMFFLALFLYDVCLGKQLSSKEIYRTR